MAMRFESRIYNTYVHRFVTTIACSEPTPPPIVPSMIRNAFYYCKMCLNESRTKLHIVIYLFFFYESPKTKTKLNIDSKRIK